MFLPDSSHNPSPFFEEWELEELLLVILLIVTGTEIAKSYDEFEEPQASRDLRLAGLLQVDESR